MSAAELKEFKHQIILDIQQVEEEEILKAIKKLLDLENIETEKDFSLSESEWLEIEADDKDYQNGMGNNFSWAEVKNLVSSKIK